MPYMNGVFYKPETRSERQTRERVDLIERNYHGKVVPEWANLTLAEVIEDVKKFKPILSGHPHQYRGSDYTPRTSPRNLKRRHPMAARMFLSIHFEIQHPKPKRSKVTVGVDFGSTDPHMVIITDEGVEPIGYRN